MGTVATQKKTDFSFFLDNSWEGMFDRVEVWKSVLSAGGPYFPLTRPTWFGAFLPADGPGVAPGTVETGPSVVIVGKTLKLRVDEKTDIDVTFTGSDPLTYAQCATQVEAQGLGLLTSYVVGGALVVQTVGAGGERTLRVVGGDAAPLLGFATTEPDSVAFGADPDVQLISGQTAYSFVDYNGDAAYFYKTRFVNSKTGSKSDFSSPFQAPKGGSASSDKLLLCFVELVGIDGSAEKGREVAVFGNFDGQQVAGKTSVGGRLLGKTDETGRVEFTILRGAFVTVSVAGTALARDVVVPTDPSITSLNLLDGSVGTDDLFKVKVPQLDYAVRRSL